MGQNYPLNKRRGGGAWQWSIIGFLPGLLCGGVIVAGILISGVFGSFGEPQVIEVTREISVGIVVTATPDPNASPAVTIITATPEPTTEVAEGAITLPTETPFIPSTAVVLETEETSVETEETVATEAVERPTSQGSNSVQSNNSSTPPELDAIKSNLVTVNGGQFQLGTTNIEILQAAQDCVSRDGGQCEASFGEDSLPAVPVEISTFSLEQTEVTFEQYVSFLNYLNSQGSRHTSGCNGFLCIQTANERPDAAVISYDGANYFIPTRLENLETHPAYGVTWYGAQAYCQALGRRLPSEAEWEFAARAGGQSIAYPWGNNWSATFANVRVPAIQTSGQSTVPVDSLVEGRNQLGLLHMAGNVAEWTADWYDTVYYSTLLSEYNTTGQPILDPRGPAGGTQKVLRGGSFNALPFFARTYHRQAEFPAPERADSTYPLWVGFRCAANGDATAANAASGGSGSGGINPSDLGVPTGEADTNAQPTAANAPESQGEEGGARG
jgi:formylglycine-generating enzyme required for sulfatase activity